MSTVASSNSDLTLNADGSGKAIKFQSNAAEVASVSSGGTLVGGSATGFRNLIYNGAMQVAQRGTSTTGVTSTTMPACDRWNSVADTSGTWTILQDTTAPDGLGYSQKYLCTTANTSLSAGSQLRHQQKFEGQDLQQLVYGSSSAKSITISFYVYSNKTGTYVVDLQNTDNSRIACGTYTISVADTWEKKTITIAGDTANGFTNDVNHSLYLSWWLVAGTNFTTGTQATVWEAQDNTNRAVSQTVNLADATTNYWHISGVQLEIGDAATPFEHRPYAAELALCQRYYQVIGDNGAYSGAFGSGYCNSTTAARLLIPVKGEMRAAPSLSVSSVSDFAVLDSGGNRATTDVVALGMSKWSVSVTATTSGLTAGQGVLLSDNATAAAEVRLDSEL